MFPLFLLHLVPVAAQLALPSPPFLPPDPSAGAVPSSGSPNPQWTSLLGNLLYFYEAQRSGNLTGSRIPWRNTSCTDDGKDIGLDLSGGYYDAGDYIKATFPLSFTLMSVCWGAIDFGLGYDRANQTAYLDSMLRWGLDWLMKAHPSEDVLIVQVADTDLDNAYWGGDRNIPTPRPSFQINSTHPGTDAAAGASAAFSVCSALYSSRTFSSTSHQAAASLKDTNYSQKLLNHSIQLYNFATTAKQQTYQTAVPSITESYASSSYGDEMTMAALSLAWAKNDTSLYQSAKNFYSQFKLQGQSSVLNWDSKTPGVYVLFAQVCASMPSFGDDCSSWQHETERYLDQILAKNAGFMTPGGLLFYDGDSDEASLNPALNAAMLFGRYAFVTTSDEKRQSYLNFAQTQVDYALGKNPMSVPYVVGVNPNSPSNPHSAMASGGNDINDINDSPPTEAYTLFGAVVGGPTSGDLFYDMRNDWPETEVALDYNAPLLTLAAMHVMNDPNDPFYTSLQAGAYDKVRPQGTPCDAVYPCKHHHGMSQGGTIALAVCISLVGATILALLVWYLYRARKYRRY